MLSLTLSLPLFQNIWKYDLKMSIRFSTNVILGRPTLLSLHSISPFFCMFESMTWRCQWFFKQMSVLLCSIWESSLPPFFSMFEWLQDVNLINRIKSTDWIKNKKKIKKSTFPGKLDFFNNSREVNDGIFQYVFDNIWIDFKLSKIFFKGKKTHPTSTKKSVI